MKTIEELSCELQRNSSVPCKDDIKVFCSILTAWMREYANETKRLLKDYEDSIENIIHEKTMERMSSISENERYQTKCKEMTDDFIRCLDYMDTEMAYIFMEIRRNKP